MTQTPGFGRQAGWRARWLAGFAACAVAGPTLEACGPFDIVAYFWLDRQPGPALEHYLRGDIGIFVQGNALEYRYVAYRHLTGLEDGVDNREALASVWPPPPSSEQRESAAAAWRTARDRVPGVAPSAWLSRSRHRAVGEGDAVYYEYFINCLDDALFNAATTLSARMERFGEASREVRAWVDAQDQVFANCSEGESIPPPLDEGWDPLIRADRAYQIAAAHFYATRYGEAATLFRAISLDADSPWRDLAAYLVARVQIRDGRFTAAENELRAVLATPRLAAMHEPARRLLGYVSLRSDPTARHRQLAQRLLAPRLEGPLRQSLIDFRWSLDHEADGDELGKWLRATSRSQEDSGSASGQTAWRGDRSTAWLVAALAAAEPESPDLEPLLSAAAAVPEDSVAYLTAAYHRSRLLIGAARTEEARATLDSLLAESSARRLAPADHNRLRFLRAEITPELEAYLRLVAVPPLGLSWDDGAGLPMRWAGDPGTAFPNYRLGQPMLPGFAVELLNHGLTAAEMLRLAEGDLLPQPWRRRLVLATWTRAAVTGNDTIALAAAPLVSTLAPELAAEMTTFSAAKGGDRRFEVAWTLLRFPGLSPILRWNVGRRTPIAERDPLRHNGWCAGVLTTGSLPNQIVRSAEQVAAVQAGLPADGLPASPNYLGQIVLFRAETHPEDPRLPEALHRVVKATRFGCPMGGYGAVSRAAFQILHRRFPASPWTKDTPYWFD